MKIRSITYFCNPGWPLDQGALDQAGAFFAAARPALESQGYPIQTTRLATIPFPLLIPGNNSERLARLATSLSQSAREAGADYLSLGPALPEYPESYLLIPQVLAETENVFFGGVMADAQRGISLPAVQACAEIIHQAAALDANGFTNLYFAALANVPPGAPFFPAAYHQTGPATFALATEAADLAVTAFSEAADLNDARQRLTAAIQTHGQALTRIGQRLAAQFDMPFGGIDFSLAPYPQDAQSIGSAIERLGVPAVGSHGTLAAAAILTYAIDEAVFPRAGFSGLFTPVLEDTVLSTRAADGALTVKDLLLYSAVCGTGLDVLPLPGDVTAGQLTALLLDVAALALRLEKPLTARLMPVPGKASGEPTDFNFDYFANSRIMALDARPLDSHLAGEAVISLTRR